MSFSPPIYNKKDHTIQLLTKIRICFPSKSKNVHHTRLWHNKKLAGLWLDNDIGVPQLPHELLSNGGPSGGLVSWVIQVQVGSPSWGVFVRDSQPRRTGIILVQRCVGKESRRRGINLHTTPVQFRGPEIDTFDTIKSNKNLIIY